ncbi:MAG TPA: hypothetical protein PKA53_10750 [Sphingobacterium sp.]|nr:hypothetical protein [Sphingobacterium sp.]
MINTIAIKECLNGQIGLRKSADTNLPEPETKYLNPKSGLFLNGIHALISVDNIWSMISAAGPIKRAVGVTDSQLLNGYLSDKMEDAIATLANKIYVEKQLNTYAKTIFPDTKLYESPATIHDTIEKQGRFVGLRLRGKAQDIALALKRISTQFERENPDFKIYLYRNFQEEPAQLIEVDCVKEYHPQWHELEDVSLSPDTTYYIGYYENDLDGRALNKNISFKKPPCSCEPTEYALWKKWNRNLEAQAFYVDAGSLQVGRTIWDPGEENYVDGYTWGLNLVFAASCDITSVFCSNKQLLVDALATQAGIMILEEMANSSRDNQQKNTVSQKAFYALDNKENRAEGLYTQLEKKIKVINLDFGSMNTACLPCQNQGIVFGTIY